MDFKQLAEQYKNELFKYVIPFWLNNSQDLEYGGYFTCLERDGKVLIPTNSSGCKDEKYGCLPCSIIK